MLTLAIPKKKRVYAIAFSPDGRDLAAVCWDDTLRVWDTITGELKTTVAAPETVAGQDLMYLGTDRLLVAGSGLFTYHLADGELTTHIVGLRVQRQLALSPDGRWLADVDQVTSTDEPTFGPSGLTLYDTTDWTLRPDPPDAINTTGGLAFSPDGRLLATAHIVRVGEKYRTFGLSFGPYPVNDYDYVVHLREMPSGRIVKTLGGWQQGIRYLAFSPDGSVLAGTAGPRLWAWDLAADRELAQHKRGTKHFQGLAFTADARSLATVSNDETVRVWDAHRWVERTTYTWKIGRLLNIAFAPDGFRAAAGSDKGQVVIWDVEA